ncbi:MAG: hypothetical protein ABIJ11_02670, partial [Elusimicrobiota bacterium]
MTTWCTVVLCLLLNSGLVYCDFEDIGHSARAIGMGNTYTGLADDANAVFYNPAGLRMLSCAELSSSYSKLWWGLKDISEEHTIGDGAVSFAYPTEKYGTLGIGLMNMAVGGLYSESVYAFSYARTFSGNIFGGLTLKLLNKGYGQTSDTTNAWNNARKASNKPDPVFDQDYSKGGFSVDLGVLYKLHDSNVFGLSLSDINQPNMDLQDETTKIPLGVKVGYAYKRPMVVFATDIKNRGKDTSVSLGVERWVHRTFAVRGGLDIGSRDYRTVSLGFGYRASRFIGADYSFMYPLSGIVNTYGTHRFSLSVRFGRGYTLSTTDASEEVELLRYEIESLMGRLESAGIKDVRSASTVPGTIKLDEKKISTIFDEGMTFYIAGKYDEAIAKF